MRKRRYEQKGKGDNQHKNLPIHHDTHDQMCVGIHSSPWLLLVQSLICGLAFP